MDRDDHVELDQVLAQSLRTTRLSQGLRQEDVANRCSIVGLPLSRAKYAQIETGRQRPRLGELLVIAAVLRTSLEELITTPAERVALAPGHVADSQAVGDFVAGRITGTELIDRGHFIEWNEWRMLKVAAGLDSLEAKPGEIVAREPDASRAALKRISNREAERRLAARLRTDPESLASACLDLWGHGLMEERDRRVSAYLDDASSEPPNVSPVALAGNVTWQLMEELRAHGLPSLDRLADDA